MGALEDLAAALVGADTQKTIAAENPYLKFQASLDPINQAMLGVAAKGSNDYSWKDYLGPALATGALSGIADLFGQGYQDRTTDKYKEAVLGAMKGDESAGLGLPKSLQRSARTSAESVLLKEAARKQNIEEAVDLKRREAEASKRGEMAGYEPEGAKDGSAPGARTRNPSNPKDKAAIDLESEATKAVGSLKIGQDFQDIKTSFDTLKDTYRYNDRGSTYAFITSFAKVLDPGAVVREDDVRNVKNTQTWLQGMGYDLQSLMKGTQQIGPDTKQEMLRAAAAKYNGYGKSYDRFVNEWKQKVEREGGNPINVTAPIRYEPFDFNDWASSKDSTQQTIAEQILPTDKAEILAKLKEMKARKDAGIALTAADKILLDSLKGSR